MLIANEEMLVSFFYNLPPLEPNEVYYVHVLERPKHESNKTKMLFRCCGDIRQILRGLKHIDILLRSGQSDFEWTREGICAYVGINPRNQIRCAGGIVKTIVENTLLNPEPELNLHNVYFNQIQTYGVVSKYLIIDLDLVDANSNRELELQKIIDSLFAIFGPAFNKHLVVKTRGGHHVILDREQLDGSWYNKFVAKLGSGMDQVGKQLLTPIPGTYQGTHVVEFVTPTLSLKDNNA